jgi:hypothetical protein
VSTIEIIGVIIIIIIIIIIIMVDSALIKKLYLFLAN